MGMGHGANWADVISNENLDEITGGLVSKLIKYLEDNGETLDSLASDIEFDGEDTEEEVYEAAVKIINEIGSAFQKEFPSLIVAIGYHDMDNGDRYDGVSGAYWFVDGMRVLSKDGKRIHDKVEQVGWVTYG